MDTNYRQLLSQLASVPGLQTKLQNLHGLQQGIPVMRSGGVDAAWSAALAHQGASAGAIPNEDLIDLYNRVGNPRQQAALERQQLVEQLQKLYGMPQLPGPRAYIAPSLQ